MSPGRTKRGSSVPALDTGVSDLMLADICADWVGELAEAGETGVADFYDLAERHAWFLKEGPAKFIPLRLRRE